MMSLNYAGARCYFRYTPNNLQWCGNTPFKRQGNNIKDTSRIRKMRVDAWLEGLKPRRDDGKIIPRSFTSVFINSQSSGNVNEFSVIIWKKNKHFSCVKWVKMYRRPASGVNYKNVIAPKLRYIFHSQLNRGLELKVINQHIWHSRSMEQ